MKDPSAPQNTAQEKNPFPDDPKFRDFCRLAVFSDETKQFRSPAEPSEKDSVRISVRVGKNTATAVFLCTEEREYLMQKTASDGLFDFYSAELPPSAKTVRYIFRFQSGKCSGYYTRYGFFTENRKEGWFEILKNFKTPDWAKGAVMYQIFPDRFRNGDPSNDVVTGEYRYLGHTAKQVRDWDALPDEQDIRSFHGGDLQGIIDRLDYLEYLGIEVLYLNPIFVSPSTHKYDTQDYDHIDPHLGKIVEESGRTLKGNESNQKASLYISRIASPENLAASDALFAKLVKEAHKRNIRVLIDGVFNHCGAFHKWLNREKIYGNGKTGAYCDKDSPCHSYFYWNPDGTYEGWWGYENHPKLNLEGSVSLRREVLAAAKKWVSPPYNADGWRLDVAADLGKTEAFNHKFWQDFRKTVKGVSSEKLILAEHYGNASAWLTGDQWDSVMNYDAFMEPVTWFLTGVSKHSTEKRDDLYNNADVFWGTMSYQMSLQPVQAMLTAMNQLSNHDHSRFLTRTNRKTGRLKENGSAAAGKGVDKAVLREAVVLLMTWVGSPAVYYGDEAGLVGWTDPDNRRAYPWGREDRELIAFHKAAISLRKAHPALKQGSLKQLFGEYGILAYGRFDKTEKLIITLNNTEERKHITIPVWQAEVQTESTMQVLLQTEKNGFSEFPVFLPVRKGQLEIILPPKSAVVLKEVE